jgi:hypothetical protein
MGVGGSLEVQRYAGMDVYTGTVLRNTRGRM